MPRATVIAVVAVGLSLACGVSEEAGAPPTGVAPADGASGPRLINDQWRILKMATAHGVFAIEIEWRDLDAAAAVTRLRVEPLAEDYYGGTRLYIRGRTRWGWAPAGDPSNGPRAAAMRSLSTERRSSVVSP